MPFDPAGNYSLPPSYKAVSGAVVRVENHNPPLEDIAGALSAVLKRDGRDGMVGPLNMGGFPIRGAQDGASASDGATVGQIASVYGQQVLGASDKATPVDADFMPIYDSAAANALKKLTWANIKATLKAYFDPLYIGAGKALLLAGGTMTGKIVLDGDPTANLHASTKQYVDNQKGLCSAWVNFNGVGSASIRRSHNVSSIVRNGIGDYTINFTKPMPSANYAVSMSTEGAGSPSTYGTATVSKTASAVRVKAGYAYTSGNVDMADFSVIVFGA